MNGISSVCGYLCTLHRHSWGECFITFGEPRGNESIFRYGVTPKKFQGYL